MPLDELAQQRFDPSNGLEPDEVAMLAVLQNPNLRQALHERHLAEAQAEVAGQWPNPQLTFGRDFSGPGQTAGLSLDGSALIAHGSAAEAANAEVLRARLSLLWQQWQVVQQVRLVAHKILFQERLFALLQTSEELALDRYSRTNAALRAGDAALDSVAADTIALQEVRSKGAEARRQTAQLRRDLNALLDLEPGVKLWLVDASSPPADAIWQGLADAAQDLPARRPDLLALKAAYASQEAHVRGAILAQFPSLNVGLNQVRDSSGILTNNVGVSINLPLFHGAGAAIAVEEASRDRLRGEYQTRLNGAFAEVTSLHLDHQLVQQQADLVRSSLPELASLARNATDAYSAHNIDALTYTALRTSYLNKQIEKLTLDETIIEQGIALKALLGQPLRWTDQKN